MLSSADRNRRCEVRADALLFWLAVASLQAIDGETLTGCGHLRDEEIEAEDGCEHCVAREDERQEVLVGRG